MALFSRVHVWVSNEVLTASDLNNEFNNLLTNAVSTSYIGFSASVAQMKTTTSPGGVGTESLASSIADELARLRYVLQGVTGGSQWYDLTGRNLKTSSLAVQTADIVDGAVTQGKRAALGQVISGTSGSYQLTSGSGTYHTVGPAAENPTITIASPAVVTIASTKAITVNDPVVFTTGGALPTGITAGTTYYVSTINNSTTFNISATIGGANIITTGTQSGTHTITYQGLSISITTTGRMVMLALVDDGSGNLTDGTADINSGSGVAAGIYAGVSAGAQALPVAPNAQLQILRGATVIASPQLSSFFSSPVDALPSTGVLLGTSYFVAATSGGSPTHAIAWPTTFKACFASWPLSSVFMFDIPPAGTYTYSVKLADRGSSAAVALAFARLVVVEL